MTLYPAIDLKDGNCVRLFKGDMNEATVFNDNPAAQAQEFVKAGCTWLHLVDLNGAFAGEPVNGDAVRSILANVDVPVQLGGGIRNIKTMEHWLDAGISRLILGTLAVKDPKLVIEACKLFPGKIAVGIDALKGMVAVEGWAEASDMEVEELAKKFEDVGVAAIIHTDIDRDGTLSGVNAEASSKLADAVTIPVIASGGVKDLSDIQKVYDMKNLEGVITGRAIYDGGMDLIEALNITKGNQ
ncbi:1-(5-phosphoribosyl)-5-[(5-phosphoribosylamino)methylideneamino]imidazole-4-carboxamide isomerase [Kordiimonas sp. SCSIO 12610]|uniref:1-(5-phosphoribosyl)-5-[(5- phosphoribosylamino)methylideneamino]imidazole-4- carboxamide isomerase n=1 Tax=Kordiimonas sp. SCSIO 12610 TaxID=2829597 RepID=UPI0021FFCF18|nr:1-(5-phosphoribosyl)-5-[(5-phosphoribosylamino)methylideneamino]imidazole-4-carboxamide isomerase [Kordiimonas sp. SCSIO 12610]